MTRIGDWGASKRDIAALDASVDKHGLWRTIVQNYVQSELTYESDRLPALSGLARQFAKHLPQQEEYLAGLWAGDLHRNLFWEVIGHMNRYSYYSAPTGTKRLNSNLPSWSWASIEWGNGIRMRWEEEPKPYAKARARFIKDARLSVLSVDCTPDGENVYGSVTGGSITLEGALCAITGNVHTIMNDGTGPSVFTAPNLPSVLVWPLPYFGHCRMSFDTEEDMRRTLAKDDTKNRLVYCLFIGSFDRGLCESDQTPILKHKALLLKPSSKIVGAFERIGCMTQRTGYSTKNSEVFTKDSRVTKVQIV
jgi:hypothetical protein